MPDTYTSPYGTTPVGTAMGNFTNTLSNIKGVAPNPQAQQGMNLQMQAGQMQQNLPQFQQQQQAGQAQQAGVPGQVQNYADESKIMELFAHDQGLSQKYTRPDMQQMGTPTQQASDVNTFGNVGVPQTPVLTQESLNQPFTGFTTPGAQNSAISMQGGQINNALDLIQKALNFNLGQVNQNVSSGVNNQQEVIKSLASLGSMLSSYGSQEATAAQGQKQITTIAGRDVLVDTQTGKILQDYGPSGSNTTALKENEAKSALASDVQNGTTFTELYSRYAGVLPEYAIRDIYNSGPMAKKYGAAKETSEDLKSSYTAKGAPTSGSSSWQMKTDSTTADKGALGLNIPFLGAHPESKKNYLFNPKTGRSVFPNENGDIHVTDLSSGQSGYVPFNEFDATKYNPIGD